MTTCAQPLRVMHVIPTLTGGGAENFLCSLVPRFDDRVVRASIMAIYPTEIPFAPEDRGRIPIITIQRTGRYDPGFFGRMVRAMREFRPDIVHTHLHNGKYWGRLAALAARVPIVVFTEHNPCGEHRIVPEILFDLIVNQLTDGIATFAEQQRSLLARAEGLGRRKVIVIENGIALPPLPTPELRQRGRRLLGAADDEVTVLVVARLIERKNQQLAIRAMQGLAPALRERVRLFIVGSGEDEPLLRAAALSSGVANRITLMGNRGDVLDLLYGGDVFYMPSLAEGMPLAMLEAMSVGVPVISTPWTGVSALLRDGELGTIVGDWEPSTSAQAICRVVNTPRDAARRAQRAMHFVRNHHDIIRTARAHEAWYQELARTRGLAAG